MNKYVKGDVVSFLKTDGEFGGLSNMASGYPLLVNGLHVRSSEHLYQALKFPGYPSVQLEILEKAEPFGGEVDCQAQGLQAVYPG